jgi:hypothetical protein
MTFGAWYAMSCQRRKNGSRQCRDLLSSSQFLTRFDRQPSCDLVFTIMIMTVGNTTISKFTESSLDADKIGLFMPSSKTYFENNYAFTISVSGSCQSVQNNNSLRWLLQCTLYGVWLDSHFICVHILSIVTFYKPIVIFLSVHLTINSLLATTTFCFLECVSYSTVFCIQHYDIISGSLEYAIKCPGCWLVNFA